jgi:hypothetical protein
MVPAVLHTPRCPGFPRYAMGKTFQPSSCGGKVFVSKPALRHEIPTVRHRLVLGTRARCFLGCSMQWPVMIHHVRECTAGRCFVLRVRFQRACRWRTLRWSVRSDGRSTPVPSIQCFCAQAMGMGIFLDPIGAVADLNRDSALQRGVHCIGAFHLSTHEPLVPNLWVQSGMHAVSFQGGAC